MTEMNNNMNPQVEISNEEEIKNLKLNNEYAKVLKLIYPNLIFYIGCNENVVRILQLSKVNKDEKDINISLPDTIAYGGETYTINQLDAAVFKDCHFLNNIKLPNHITVIERSSFKEASISELTLPDHLERIEPEAFYDCYMDRLEVPETVMHIGEHAWTQAEIKEIWFKNEQSLANGFENDPEWELFEDEESWILDRGYVLDEKLEEGSEHFINWYGLTVVDDDEYQGLVKEFYQQYWTIPAETTIYVGKDKKEIANPEK